MVYQVEATITSNRKISPDVYAMDMIVPKMGPHLKPGHFIHMRIGTGVDPLLRRPFGVNSVIRKGKKTIIGIVYRVVGKGTILMTEKRSGETVDLLGPLGNGFSVDLKKIKNRQVVLVAGGMGVAPLVYLAEYLKNKTKKPLQVFLGGAKKDDIVCSKEFKKAGAKVLVSTDDGSSGYKGFVSDLLEEYLTKRCTLNAERYIYACGPFPMLRALNDIANEHKLEGQVSVDEMMGCGIGACLGCVIKTKDNNEIVYKRICKDGPVFDIQEIVWEDE